MKEELGMRFRENGGILRTGELREAGLFYDQIRKMIDRGEIEKLRRGYYQLVSDQMYSDIPTIVKLFPDAVLCMESALDYYGYTNRTPLAWHLAVPYASARNRFHIDYPIVKPHFVREEKFPVGITTVTIDQTEIGIYDRERTICDLLLHRNKLDAEVFNTAIQRYIVDPDRNVANLMAYAKKLRVERKAREVVGIWL